MELSHFKSFICLLSHLQGTRIIINVIINVIINLISKPVPIPRAIPQVWDWGVLSV